MHSVTIKILSGVVEFDWCAADLRTLTNDGAPRVYLTPTTIRSSPAAYLGWQTDPADTATIEQKIVRCNNVYKENAARLTGMGLNVAWIDIAKPSDPGTDISGDGVHPGTYGQIKMSATLESAMNQVLQGATTEKPTPNL